MLHVKKINKLYTWDKQGRYVEIEAGDKIIVKTINGLIKSGIVRKVGSKRILLQVGQEMLFNPGLNRDGRVSQVDLIEVTINTVAKVAKYPMFTQAYNYRVLR